MGWNGAAQGAVAGGAAGTVIAPGIGTAIGAGAGALIGSGAFDKVLQPMWGAIKSSVGGQNSYSPTAPVLNQDASNADAYRGLDARGRQGYLADQLALQMQGNGPSVAALQAQQGVAQAQQNALAQANSARGVSRGLAQRSAVYAGQQAQQGAIRDASLLRAQEQLSAAQNYGNTAGQMRQGDTLARQLDLNAAQADQTAQVNTNQQQTQISNENAGRAQKATSGLMSMAGGLLAMSDVALKDDIKPIRPDSSLSFAEKLRASLPEDTQPVQIQQGLQMQPQQGNNGLMMLDSANASQGAQSAGQQKQQAQQDSGDSGGGITQAGFGNALQSFGSVLSDERSKENLAPLQPYSYRYKPEAASMLAEQLANMAPPGKEDAARGAAYEDARSPREGIMAQDLLKSPDGKKVVKNTPVGLALDKSRAISFALANQAGLDKRLRTIEEALSGRNS